MKDEEQRIVQVLEKFLNQKIIREDSRPSSKALNPKRSQSTQNRTQVDHHHQYYSKTPNKLEQVPRSNDHQGKTRKNYRVQTPFRDNRLQEPENTTQNSFHSPLQPTYRQSAREQRKIQEDQRQRDNNTSNQENFHSLLLRRGTQPEPPQRFMEFNDNKCFTKNKVKKDLQVDYSKRYSEQSPLRPGKG